MAFSRWCLPASVCCLMLTFYTFVVGGEGSDGLDPRLREELHRGIEQRYPKVDPKIRREILREIERTPKLRCTIESVTVYTDGIVCRATLSCDLPYDCRFSFLGCSLSPVRSTRLIDSEKNEWDVPRLANHYLFVSLEKSWTVLVPQGKSLSIIRVDELESPRPVRIMPPPDKKMKNPSEFSYRIAHYTTAYSEDLKKHEYVFVIGSGKTPVEWKNSSIPPGMKTGAVKSQKRQP
jgi:hypothetical protein